MKLIPISKPYWAAHVYVYISLCTITVHRITLIIFHLILQTVIIAQMLFMGERGALLTARYTLDIKSFTANI